MRPINTYSHSSASSSRESSSSQHCGNADDELNHFLSRHDHCFADSVYKQGFSVMSSDLKKVLEQLKHTQGRMTQTNLEGLQRTLNIWQSNNPREFQKRGHLAESLKQEIQLRQQDPLHGLSGQVKTNRELLQLVKQIYGGSASRLFADKIPSITDNTPLGSSTLSNMKRALSASFFQNFKLAESMVSADIYSLGLNEYTHLVSAELAKLPEPLLKLANSGKLKVALVQDRLYNYSNFNMSTRNASARGWHEQSEKNLPGVYQRLNNTVIITLTQGNQGNFQINPNHGSKNLVLHESAHGIDQTASKVLGLRSPLSSQPGFIEAWQNDFSILDSYYLQQDQDGKYTSGMEEAFAEGIAKTFDSPSASNWPHIEAYMQALPRKIANGNYSSL